ncbi:MAG: glycosyl transferase group 1, partial [Bryobacterales bacterium]|nr:glycosyl transferase group 1 [Bryobacterales bacterium]
MGKPSHSNGDSRGVLMLATMPESLAAKSGFTRLVDYVENAELLGTRRSQGGKLPDRAARLALSQLSITSWYQLSSARLEFLAWKRMREGFAGVLHVLWADSDLGYLDLISTRRGVALCATFHACPDTLPEVIRHPHRLRNIDAITVVSRTQSDFFVSHGVAPERITFLPHGIDVDYFTPGSREYDKVFTVLAVGSYRR